MEKSFQSGAGNSEVVSVLGIPFIVGSGGSGGCKEVVHGGVRQDNLGPLSGVGGVATLTGGTKI